MTPRLAVHLSDHQLPEMQRAARVLLRSPLVTAAAGPDFRLIRKWETVLRNEFGQKLAYRLDVSRSAARLLRRPATVSRHRGARLDTGRHLSRWAYVYLCLALAAIEQPGHQVLASELLARIEQSVRGDERLRLDSTEYAQRRAFRDAVRYLEQTCVLKVRDGDVESLLADGQVLFDIDRDAAAMCMVASPSILREVETIDDFVAEPEPTTMDGRRRRARQRLNRRLIDQPVVMLEDLDEDEAELAWRNRRREAENIARLTGCAVELRREGLALVDHPIQPIGDRHFPSSDAVAHAALLWLDALVQASEEPGGAGGDEGGDGEPRVYRPIDQDVADRSWQSIIDGYGSRFGKASIDRPEQFRALCVDLLDRFGLARSVAGGPEKAGISVSAFANRFRARATLVDQRSGQDGGADAGDGVTQTSMF